MKTLLTLLSFLTLTSVACAQEVWSLQRCIDYAQQNNLTLQQAKINTELTAVNERSARWNQLPSLDVGVNGGLQFGRTIDPTTNTFDNQTIGFNSFQLNAGMIVYNGGNLRNAVKAADINTQAALADLDAAVNTMGLNVANAYLQALMTREQLRNAQRQSELTRQQLERTRLLIGSGAVAPNDSINLVAQLARNDQSVIQLENTYTINVLSIKQLLQLNEDAPFELESLDFDIDAFDNSTMLLAVEQVFQKALNTQPGIQSADLQRQAAQLGVEQARGTMFPRLSVFANVNSNFSSAFSDFQNPDLSNAQQVLNDPVPVQINGDAATLQTFSVQGIEFPTVPYFDQMENNFGQAVGVALSIPIFNSGQGRLQTERAQLNARSAQVQYEQARQQLRAEVERALADAKTAFSNYEAAEKAVDAAQIAFDNEQSRLDVGAANPFDFNTAQLNLQNAETDLIRSKYEYLFRLKILDFYLGKPLTIRQ